MTRAQLIQALKSQITKELEALTFSAKAAHLAATHEESRAEDKHDTFAIEASYLAKGQSDRILALEQTLAELGNPIDTLASNEITVGSVFQISLDKKNHTYVMLNSGGGKEVALPDLKFSILSPKSPLGEQLMGLKAGDEFEVESANQIKTGKLLKIF